MKFFTLPVYRIHGVTYTPIKYHSCMLEEGKTVTWQKRSWLKGMTRKALINIQNSDVRHLRFLVAS